MRNLTLSLVSVVLIATIGLGWMFDRIYSQYQQDNQHQQKDAISVLEQVGSQLASAIAQLDNRQAFINHWPNTGQFTLKIVALKNYPLPANLLANIKKGNALLLETDDSIALHFYLSGFDELLILTTPQLLASTSHTALAYIFTSLFYLAILMLVLLWVYPLAKRLLALRKAAKAFGEGNLSQRISVGSRSYIRDLEQEFNRMAQRIDDLVNDIKLLSSAVSHDLRTPLARIRFGIDTIQEEDDPILRKRFEQRISDNVDEMVDLVETLLNYARLDQTLISLNKAPVDLSNLLLTCINNKAQDNIELTFIAPNKPVLVKGDLSYLMILVSNLLQNAYQYADSRIQVTLEALNEEVNLVVCDDGEGIAPTQREQILKPFIRGEENSKKVKGYGMGLAIVKRIVEWHQGRITINNSATLSGAEFTVTLPKV